MNVLSATELHVNMVKIVYYMTFTTIKKVKTQDDDRKNEGVSKDFHVSKHFRAYNWVIRIILSFTNLKMS